MRRLPVFLVGVALLAQTPAQPTPMPEPVIELHRTAQGDFSSPAERNPLFVLVIGSDIRQGDPTRGRADSLHIVAINTASGAGTIVGIPRDSYVPIAGGGRAKINASLASGNPQRTVQTVSQLAGIPIHYWALVEFSRFRDLIDRLEGLDVVVPYPMADSASGAFFEAGPFHMNGASALAFARARKTIPGGDFGRSENQGRLLLAALEKFREQSSDPFRLLDYFAAFRDLVLNDVPVPELIDLALVARHVDPAAVQNVVLPGGSGSAGGASIVVLGGGAQAIFDAIRDDGVL